MKRQSKSLIALVTWLTTLAMAGSADAQLDFTDWHAPSEIEGILNALQTAHPGRARVQNIGTSISGAPIRALKISDNVDSDSASEGDVVFFGMHHAREWMTVEMTLYLAEYLLVNYDSDPRIKSYVDNLEIWIVPVVNPDGYAHTAAPGGRFWRKNRRDNGDGTRGVDLNRNWGFEWGRDDGSSGVTSNDTYRGTAPYSEPEILSMRNFADSLDNLKAVVSYHSYGQFWLRPWAYSDANAPGESVLHALTLRSIADIAAVNGVVYGEFLPGSLGTASGETTDYFWGEKRVAAFTPELRPLYNGTLGGFDPSPTQIIPTLQENLPAALSLLQDAAETRVWIKDHPDDDATEPSAVWTGDGWSRAFWRSPDIWTVPETLNQGAVVDLNVRVRNDTPITMGNVRVEVYYTDPRISLEFPNPDAVMIDSWTGTVSPGGRTLQFEWSTPVGTNSWGERHWCVGVVIYHDDDLPLTTETRRTSNIGSRNFNTTEIVEAGSMMLLAATNFLDVDAELQYSFDEASLPAGWSATLGVPQDQVTGRPPRTSIERKGALLGATGPLLAPGETIYVPLRVQPPNGAPSGAQATVEVSGALLPLVAGEREPVGNGFTYRVKKN